MEKKLKCLLGISVCETRQCLCVAAVHTLCESPSLVACHLHCMQLLQLRLVLR